MITVFMFLSVVFSGIYLWSSGLPQVSHAFYPLMFLSLFFLNRIRVNYNFNYILLFVAYSSVVNFYYYFKFDDISFLLSSFQIVFDIVVYISVLSYLMIGRGAVAKFSKFLILALMIQWGVYLSGFGNYEFYPRYSGTFNDPNQMGFWVLCVSCVLLSVVNDKPPFLSVVILISCLVFSFLTMSRSVMIAIPFLMVGFMREKGAGVQSLMTIGSLTALVVVIYLVLSGSGAGYIDRILDVNIAHQLSERGYTRFIDFPEYSVFGGGHGMHERFNYDKPVGFQAAEIHSSFAGVLFYYGIVGFLFMALFIYNIYLKLSAIDKFYLVSILVFGLTTYSVRTPIFWVALAYFTMQGLKGRVARE